jgi:hypothetical protein
MKDELLRVKHLRFLRSLLFKPFTPHGLLRVQIISFLEKCVHGGGVHQGNEENEEFCPAPEPNGVA